MEILEAAMPRGLRWSLAEPWARILRPVGAVIDAWQTALQDMADGAILGALSTPWADAWQRAIVWPWDVSRGAAWLRRRYAATSPDYSAMADALGGWLDATSADLFHVRLSIDGLTRAGCASAVAGDTLWTGDDVIQRVLAEARAMTPPGLVLVLEEG